MRIKLLIAVLLFSVAASAQTAWTNVGNGLQQRVVVGKTEYRFTKISPYVPFGITDSLAAKVDYVESIADLSAYYGFSRTVIVRDSLRGGIFNKVASGLTPNLGTIFTAKGGGYWERNFSGDMNINWFGAKGDNVTDNTTAFQNALNLRKSIYVKIGNYRISSALTVYGFTHIRGEDRNNSSIIQTSAGANTFNIGVNEQFVHITDLMLSNSSINSTGSAIAVSGKNHRFEGMVIYGYGTGIKVLAGTTPIFLNQIDILGCPNYGIDLDASGGNIVGVFMDKVQSQVNGVGMRIKGNVNQIVANLFAARVNTGGILAEADALGNVPTNNWLNNVDVDSNHGYGIKLNAGNNYFFNQPWASNPAPGDPINTFDYNFYIGPGVTNVSLTDYKSYLAGKNGIDILGNKVILNGADIQGAGRGVFNTYDGIVLGGSLNQINNSRVWSDNVNNRTRYAVNISTGTTGYKISNNDLKNVFNTIKIQDNAGDVNSEIFNNTGADSRINNNLNLNGILNIISPVASTNNRLSLDLYNFNNPAFLGSNNAGNTSKSMLFQPFGGNSIFGRSTDDGNVLQVEGKATVSAAPTNPTDVVRKTELDLKATDADVLHKAGAENITGSKTFNTTPPFFPVGFVVYGSFQNQVGATGYATNLQPRSGTLAYTVQPGDIEITQIGNGVIVPAPNGTRWRITVSNAGALVVTAL